MHSTLTVLCFEPKAQIKHHVTAEMCSLSDSVIALYMDARLSAFEPRERSPLCQNQKCLHQDCHKQVVMQNIAGLLTDTAAINAVEQYIAQRASRGLRAVGVAQSHDQGATWELVGLISLLDPPRADSAETIKHAQALGVKVSRHKGFTLTVVCMHAHPQRICH